MEEFHIYCWLNFDYVIKYSTPHEQIPRNSVEFAIENVMKCLFQRIFTVIGEKRFLPNVKLQKREKLNSVSNLKIIH